MDELHNSIINLNSTKLNEIYDSKRHDSKKKRDCVSRHNGGTSGAPLIPPRDDSALIILSCERSPCEGLLYFYYLRQMMHLSNQLNDFFFQHVFLKSPVQREPGLR